MSKHTPGPWSWYTRNGHKVAIDGPDGAEVARAEEYGASAWIEVSEYDARLIAAAPDMLAALVEATACGMVPITSAAEGGASSYSAQVRCADNVRAAIAKATGVSG